MACTCDNKGYIGYTETRMSYIPHLKRIDICPGCQGRFTEPQAEMATEAKVCYVIVCTNCRLEARAYLRVEQFLINYDPETGFE